MAAVADDALWGVEGAPGDVGENLINSQTRNNSSSRCEGTCEETSRVIWAQAASCWLCRSFRAPGT